MNKPDEITMDNNQSGGIDLLSLLFTGLYFFLGILHSFQDVIIVAVGLSTSLYNVFKFLKENFPMTYKRIMNYFK